MASKSTQPKKIIQRKLTAILCADVAGYSRLMGVVPVGRGETRDSWSFTRQRG